MYENARQNLPHDHSCQDSIQNLSEEEAETYAWQLDVRDFGVAGQARLKSATVLISRVGGLGSLVAYELAAAGVGHLVLAHAGTIQRSDLNRQLLMTAAGVGTARVDSAARRLRELNPRLRITAIPENLSPANAERLVGMADCIVDAAPLFQERLAMNDAAEAQGKPVVEAAMFELEASLTVIHPPRTPRFRDLVPDVPPGWQRRFPVFGAVSGTVGCLAAIVAGFAEPLYNRLLRIDLRAMRFETIHLCPSNTTINNFPDSPDRPS